MEFDFVLFAESFLIDVNSDGFDAIHSLLSDGVLRIGATIQAS